MGSLNKGEIGQPLYINFGEDISLATPTLILLPQWGTKKEFTTADGVTIPATNTTFGTTTLLANQYVKYITTNESDLDYVGRWRFKAKLNFSSTDIRQSDYERFVVKA